MLPKIEIGSRPDHCPLSFSQEHLFIADHMEASIGSHLPLVLSLTGKMSTDLLSRSLQTIVERHEILRTVIYDEGGRQYQNIQDYKDWKLTIVNASAYDGEALQTAIRQIINAPFNLLKDYMMRASLLVMNETDHILVVTTHPIAADCWSLSIIVKELAEIYGLYLKGQRPLLSPLPFQFADYAVWQREYLQGATAENKLAYWKEKLEALSFLQLPADFARPMIQSTRCASAAFTIDKALKEQVLEICRPEGVNLFMFLVSAFKVLFYRYTGQQDICLGTLVSGRQQQGLSNLVGSFENTLALRTEVDPAISFKGLLQKVKQTTLEAFEYQDMPFEMVVDAVVKEKDSSRNPFFPVLFVLRDTTAVPETILGDLTLSGLSYEHTSSEYDLAFYVTETNKGLSGLVEYSTELFSEQTINRMMAHFNELLHSIVNDPLQKSGALSLLTKEEEKELLEVFNDTALDYPRDKTIIELFEQQVQLNPSGIAVMFEEEELTFGELSEQSNRLANYLIENGIRQGANIGLLSYRGIEMIVGMIGILKAGCAYVPFNIEYPAERINYIIEDAAIELIVYTSHELLHSTGLNRLECIHVNDSVTASVKSPGIKARIDSCAYIMFTSGTTGHPKGIAVSQRNIIKLVHDGGPISVTASDRLLQWSNYSFDGSTYDIYSALLKGASICMIKDSWASDVEELSGVIASKKITVCFITTALFNTFVDVQPDAFAGLRKILFGGEMVSVSHVNKALSILGPGKIVHVYGPTETTVYACSYAVDEVGKGTGIPIGRPLSNTRFFVLSGNKKLQPVGVPGELYIGGEGVSLGYVNNPLLTSERFIQNPFSDDSNDRLYRTGDIVRWLSSGDIEYLSRADDQVKIRGFRIELGEIESVLQQCELVVQAVVLAKEDMQSNRRLVGYIVPFGSFDREGIISYLNEKLPPYMVPALWVEMESLPLTPNGKINRKDLPDPDISGSMVIDYVPPGNEMEKQLVEIWQELLELDRVGINDNFFKLGGDSLLAIKTVSILKKQFNYVLPIIKLFQYPTVAEIVKFLKEEEENKPLIVPIKIQPGPAPSSDVAVIGMAGRFPGANTVEELWEILKNGKETIRFFAKDELDPSIPIDIINDPEYVSARGIIDDADKFDAAFFDLNPKLAELMDPQQRIFLEIVWEILEKTGHLPQKYNGRIGVYAGAGINSYYINNVHGHSKLIDQVGSFQVMTANEKDFVATRASYQLNLKGPSVSVYSGCSTSLLAVALAVESIRKGQCDVAVAGASSITSPVNSGHLYQEGAMLSRDGHCRSFDADSSGTVFSDGAGVVLLKALEAAKMDRDTIYAVIKGVGLSNDGGGKGSFTAPSSEGQAKAIVMAFQDAGIDPSTISYVETHGTGTPIGDPIEVEGLRMAFGNQQQHQFCAIGSVKSNIGHVTASAGVAGLIKTMLALQHRQIPPSLGFVKPNPNIDFEHSPFYVNAKLAEWKSETVRRAGVSSFGVGGTNVHVVLEEYENEVAVAPATRPLQLITLSAKSESALAAYSVKLAAFLSQHNTAILADTAYTLQITRPDFNCRRFVLARDTGELTDALLKEPGSLQVNNLKEVPGEVVFMFPGQGSQYLNMGAELYANESVYREAIDECAAILMPHIGLDIRQVIFPGQSNPEAAEEQLINTRYTQPAIFVTEYALARLWMNWGIEPTAFCGHSIGEFVAAYFAGIFTLPEALALIATRGRLVSELPRGSMLSVRMESTELTALLPENLSVAAINSDKLCVVAGEVGEVAAFARILDGKAIANKILFTSHAFHSAMMDPIIGEFEEVVSKVNLKRPVKSIVSTVSGNWLKDEQAIDPGYWSKHLRSTVRFADAIETLLKKEHIQFIEVGPGNALSTLVKQQSGARKVSLVNSLEKGSQQESEYGSILKALGRVWLNGLAPGWKNFYGEQNRMKINLPTYSFARKHCWVDPVVSQVNNDEGIKLPGVITDNLPIQYPEPIVIEINSNHEVMRKENLIIKIKEILEDASGIETGNVAADITFIEIGLDSLLLTQVALTLKKEFGLPLTFRQLNEEFATIELLAQYIDENLAAEQFQPRLNSQPRDNGAAKIISSGNSNINVQYPPDGNLDLITQQLQLLAKQVALLQGSRQTAGTNNEVVLQAASPGKSSGLSAVIKDADLTPEEAIEIKKPFGATPRIERQVTNLTDKQKAFLKDLTDKYNEKTKRSKAYTQEHRPYMSDPRVVTGFKPLSKEVVYPVVVNKSSGSRLWDLDGNEYIDVLNGFGSCMFGYRPDFIRNALHEQVEKGFEVGPQHELAGEVTRMICDFTGFERAALCSTGSEAVLGTMRIARTVTGRSLIVAFTGSYHGIMDEVLVRGTKKLKSYPAAPGIMPEAVQNMLILDYGTNESLQIIKERAHELAAVLVEPIQSRNPENRPVEFLKQVREITRLSGTVLIFDEVITGFRVHPGGAQALFGIKADVASYGKVVGGGLPIGVIAGRKELMDALDGGFWQYGDTSFPEVGVTYFAGTFVRHPLALATAKASLQYMKEMGPDLQRNLNAKGDRIANSLNVEFEKRKLPFFVTHFGSLWKIKFKEEVPYSELLFVLMRLKGVHVWDGFPCFMTVAHTEEEIDLVIKLFIESTDEMIRAGFFKAKTTNGSTLPDSYSMPPVAGAKLGRDEEGNPAWYISDKNRPGKFLKVEANS